MKIGNKNQIIVLISIFLLIFSFILFGFLRIRKEDKLLEQSPVFGIAVIVDTYVGTKARDFVRYEFTVDGKIYDGHQRFYPNLEVVEIGDTCDVIFAKYNPDINELLVNENNRIKVRRNRAFNE